MFPIVENRNLIFIAVTFEKQQAQCGDKAFHVFT
jgi:hypothetical protein